MCMQYVCSWWILGQGCVFGFLKNLLYGCSNLRWKLLWNRVGLSHLPSLSAVEFHVDRRSFVPMASFWADYTGRTLPFPPHSLYPSPLLSQSDSLHSSHLSIFHRGDEEGIRLSERKKGGKKAYSCFRARIALILCVPCSCRNVANKRTHQRWIKSNFQSTDLNLSVVQFFFSFVIISQSHSFQKLVAPVHCQ